jgi:hypothetical protein
MFESRRVTLVLLICALGGYLAILASGRQARDRVVDASVLGAQLAADGHDAINTAFNADNGSAAIGIDYHHESSVQWTVAPVACISRGHRYLYISSDDPEFFSPNGSVVVTVNSETVAIIRAQPIVGGTNFIDDPRREAILMPPERTLGYRFALGDSTCSNAPCAVSVHGMWSFWHVNRLAIVGEASRFVADRSP